jgi:transketolase
MGWDYAPFVIPEEIKDAWDARLRGRQLETDWRARFDRYREAYPELATEFDRRMRGELPADWSELARELIATVAAEAKDTATRQSSQRALEGYAPRLPELFGGSADLTGSNNTFHSGSKAVSASDPGGNYIHFGVREFGMAAIMNGLSLHGGLIPYGGTFLVFSDYARNALRMAALIGARAIYVLTHDSIGLGEDGPTHQPVEHLASLRAMPNMHIWRPCDGVETAVAWRAAIERASGPTGLILTRQSVPHMPRSADQVDAIARGGYILLDSDGAPEIILIATGSEVALAVAAARQLHEEKRRARVVSMPSTEVFDLQDEAYRTQVLPASGARLVIEAGVADGWWRYVAGRGRVIAMEEFGKSAPAKDLFEYYGYTAEAITAAARELIS